MSSTYHKAPRYVVFSTPLLLCPSYAHIFSSVPYSQTHTAYVLPSTWRTKFHTHTKQTGNILVMYALILNFWIANWKAKDSTPNDISHTLTAILHRMIAIILWLSSALRETKITFFHVVSSASILHLSAWCSNSVLKQTTNRSNKHHCSWYSSLRTQNRF